MQGFQLWVNLPKSNKMMAPRYREVKQEDIPEIQRPGGVTIKIISGRVDEIRGPVQDIVVDIEYLDVTLPPGNHWLHPVKKGYKAFAYIFAGSGFFAPDNKETVASETLLVYRDGDRVSIISADQGLRFLLVSGKPLNEPVAWGGPIVMNTQAELDLAFREFQDGTFIKNK
jgi:redox-sensitive bicupin YhaK (pirin superfamily)